MCEEEIIRPLNQQFEPDKAQRIRELESLFQSLPFENKAAKYFTIEVVRCLEAGLLLAAFEVAMSLLELFIRELLIMTRFGSDSGLGDTPSRQLFRDTVEREVEDVEHLSLNQMMDELEGLEIISERDSDKVKELYKTVRVPIHHGLTRRLLFPPSFVPKDYLDFFFSGARNRFHKLEELVEDNAIRHLFDVVDFMGKYSKQLD